MSKDVFISLTREELAFVQDCIGFATTHQSLYAAIKAGDEELTDTLNTVGVVILRRLNNYPKEVADGAFKTIIGPLPEGSPFNMPVKDIIEGIENIIERITKHE